MDLTKERPEDDLTDLERRLRQWQPTALGLDRDRMLFEAGRATARAEIWGWVPIGSIAALLIVAVGLGVLVARERGEYLALEHRFMEATMPTIEPAPALIILPIVEHPPAPDSYLVLTRNMLSSGPEMMTLPVPETRRDDSVPNAEPTLRARGSGELINF